MAKEKLFANPKSQKEAITLLAAAGWSARDSQGRLVKDGKPLTMEYLYADKGAERWLTTYQEDLRKVGITLNLRLSSYETLLQLQGEHKFDLVSVGFIRTRSIDSTHRFRRGAPTDTC